MTGKNVMKLYNRIATENFPKNRPSKNVTHQFD